MSLGRVLQPLGTIGKTAKLHRSIKPNADNVIQLGDTNENFSKIYTYSVRKANDFEIAFEGENLVIREPEDNNAIAYEIRDTGGGGAFSHGFYCGGSRKLIIEDKVHVNTDTYVDGRIGVGTTSPEQSIHVYCGVNDGILVESSGDHPRLMLRGYYNGNKYTLTFQGGYHGRALEILFPAEGYYISIWPPGATSENTTVNPAFLQWKGRYWDGSSSKDFDFNIVPEVLDTTPTAVSYTHLTLPTN